MAIEIIVGNVGAGKTYYATYTIWEEIKKIYNAEITGKAYKYTHILTNIEGIKPNKYVKLLKVAELIKLWEWELKQYKAWENKYSNIEQDEINFNFRSSAYKDNSESIITHYLNKKDNIREFKTLNDKILHHINIPNDLETAYINYVKPTFEKSGYTNCLIVIDEAHNFFKVLSAAKERLVSYHRHYDQDYILITQELKQLNRKVTGIAQKTIAARNPVAKAGKSFNYKIYSGGYISFRDNNLLERVRLKADPDIFRLYTSGSVKQQKSYFGKKILRGVVLVLGVVLGGVLYWKWFTTAGKNSLVSNAASPKHIKINKVSEPSPILKKPYIIIKATRIGNFYFYKNKKYSYTTFTHALAACNAIFFKFNKHFDSTVTEYYKIKDPRCLDLQLSSSAL